jgi:hypothetical protein
MYALRRTIGLLMTGTAAVGVLSACGAVDASTKPTDPRPPADVTVRAAITDDGVHISPTSIGGGPVRVIFSNQTTRPVRGTLSGGDQDRRRTRQPIAPGSTATITTIVAEGGYRVIAGKGTKRQATLTVGPERESSDGDLFLP